MLSHPFLYVSFEGMMRGYIIPFFQGGILCERKHISLVISPWSRSEEVSLRDTLQGGIPGCAPNFSMVFVIVLWYVIIHNLFKFSSHSGKKS